jgi:energy-coupling factor transporter ATP-binding protein EcfA2
MRLRRLEIHRLLNIEPGTVLTFSDGINVVLGRNGAGKTTLLDTIAMVLRGPTDILPPGEEYDVAYQFELEAGVIDARLTARALSFEGGKRTHGAPDDVGRVPVVPHYEATLRLSDGLTSSSTSKDGSSRAARCT